MNPAVRRVRRRSVPSQQHVRRDYRRYQKHAHSRLQGTHTRRSCRHPAGVLSSVTPRPIGSGDRLERVGRAVTRLVGWFDVENMIELAPSGRRGGFLIIAIGSAFSSELVECFGVHLRRLAGSTGTGEPSRPGIERFGQNFYIGRLRSRRYRKPDPGAFSIPRRPACGRGGRRGAVQLSLAASLNPLV